MVKTIYGRHSKGAKSPCHDGGAIIRNGWFLSARTFFSTADNIFDDAEDEGAIATVSRQGARHLLRRLRVRDCTVSLAATREMCSAVGVDSR